MAKDHSRKTDHSTRRFSDIVLTSLWFNVARLPLRCTTTTSTTLEMVVWTPLSQVGFVLNRRPPEHAAQSATSYSDFGEASHGHFAPRISLGRAIGKFYWPRRYETLVEYCRSCHQCQIVGLKPPREGPQAVIPLEPMQLFAMDYIGPITPVSRLGARYIPSTWRCSQNNYVPLTNGSFGRHSNTSHQMVELTDSSAVKSKPNGPCFSFDRPSDSVSHSCTAPAWLPHTR